MYDTVLFTPQYTSLQCYYTSLAQGRLGMYGSDQFNCPVSGPSVGAQCPGVPSRLQCPPVSHHLVAILGRCLVGAHNTGSMQPFQGNPSTLGGQPAPELFYGIFCQWRACLIRGCNVPEGMFIFFLQEMDLFVQKRT